MPNQLAKSKRRHSLAEHKSVLAALEAIAAAEQTTVAALLRRAARELIREHLARHRQAAILEPMIWQFAPKMPAKLKTAAQLARFKREQREFDQVVLDLKLATPAAIQKRNSVASGGRPVRILELEGLHATTR